MKARQVAEPKRAETIAASSGGRVARATDHPEEIKECGNERVGQETIAAIRELRAESRELRAERRGQRAEN